MHAKFLFLGSGGSLGVPVVSCTCRVCRSLSPLDKRLRPSGLLTLGEKRFLIDVGPDFREQALRYNIADLDGVLITHTHNDHIAGLDELRVFYFMHKKRLALLSSKESFEDIQRRFFYLFKKGEYQRADLDFKVLDEDFGSVEFEGEKFETITYFQSSTKVTGYRWGNFAYISDIHKYDDKVIEALKGVEILVLSALRFTTSEVHFSIPQAIEFSQKVGAIRTFFTHIAHDIEHEETSSKLPAGFSLGHDGLEIDLT